MRRLTLLLAVSMLFVGTCVQDVGKLTTVERLGESVNMIGCTWDATGWAPLPRCLDYY